LTVAHVALIKEEVVAVEEVVVEPTEPEVAKKGKGEAEGVAEAKPDAKAEAKPDAKADAKKK
jgi:large subunit ribosomal protein L25